MTREFRDYLDDMLEYAGKARDFVDGMGWEDFLQDEKTRLATIRAIEVVGEAARRIPPAFQAKCPEIPWQRMIGMRNILAHDYLGTNPRVVFDTATIFIPQLIALLPAAIAKASEEG